jgi:hypothetical protein
MLQGLQNTCHAAATIRRQARTSSSLPCRTRWLSPFRVTAACDKFGPISGWIALNVHDACTADRKQLRPPDFSTSIMTHSPSS